MAIQATAQKLLRKFGKRLLQLGGGTTEASQLSDLSAEDRKIIASVRPYTLTSVERISAMIDATRHVCAAGVPGAIVECGVWRGGSAMAGLLTLIACNDRSRDIYLYDTFEGMSAPTTDDVRFDGMDAGSKFEELRGKNEGWCLASLDDVKANVLSTQYPAAKIKFIKGKVEDTIPSNLPTSIALLRLDTDWYESTRHELQHLFPLLHPQGILLIDDYGYWAGARKAVDEYFQSTRNQYFFHRIDYTGRLVTKIGG